MAVHGIFGMTITEVRGAGNERRPVETYRGIAHESAFVNKLKVEVVLEDEEFEDAVAAVVSAASTGNAGDGKIFITDLTHVVRIRTGEELMAVVSY